MSHFTKHEFLGAAAAPAFVPPSDRIAVGVIGVGPRGTYVLSHFLKECDVRVVAVCDCFAERLERRNAQFGNIAAMFAGHRCTSSCEMN